MAFSRNIAVPNPAAASPETNERRVVIEFLRDPSQPVLGRIHREIHRE
jgi:hypothetical protein